jgi:hypothetical protein
MSLPASSAAGVQAASSRLANSCASAATASRLRKTARTSAGDKGERIVGAGAGPLPDPNERWLATVADRDEVGVGK